MVYSPSLTLRPHHLGTVMPESSQHRDFIHSPEVGPPQKCLHTSSDNGRPLNLSLMPREILLAIASELSPSARGLLAFTCKSFARTLVPLVGLKKPAEQPSNFQESRMSEPQLYQPERWEFLRLIEKDLSGRWLLCFDCFILHPDHMFAKRETSLTPWLKNYGGLFRSQSQPRSCRYLPCATDTSKSDSYSPCGIVDLCPCNKMTPWKKRRIQAKLRKLEHDNNNHSWWHICRHVYGDIRLEIKLGFCSYDDDGELGVAIDYHFTQPFDSSSVSPRMLCPHIHLDTFIETLSQCRDLHSDQVVCTRCKDLQRCKYCLSTVFTFTKEVDFTTATNSYVLCVERRLAEKIWYEHTIFPYARQRQHDSKGKRSGWKLW